MTMIDIKPVDTKVARTQPVGPKMVDFKPVDTRAVDPRLTEAKTAETKPAEAKTAEAKTGVPALLLSAPVDRRATIPSLAARIEERILAPIRRNPRARQWFAVTVAAILALHGGLLAFFLYRDTPAPELVAKQEPPAIEVVVEPPKPEPKAEQKKPPPPKPEAKQEIEKPASSAPRAPNEQKVDTEATDKETHAPMAPTPPKDGKPEPSKEAASPETEAAEKEKTEEAAVKPDVLKQAAEALDKAKEQAKKTPEKVAKVMPKPKARRAKTALQQLAGASDLPDYKFARPTKKSPVYGGTEDSRYLAIVYGMIMQHRARVSVPGGDGGNVTIAFNVDGAGNLIGMGIERTSGYPSIDAAAAAAIRRASPFPPPPAGAPHGLIATISFGESDDDAYTMGSRDR